MYGLQEYWKKLVEIESNSFFEFEALSRLLTVEEF